MVEKKTEAEEFVTTINVNALLGELKRNRTRHKKLYDMAMGTYRKTVLDKLLETKEELLEAKEETIKDMNEQIERARAGKDVDSYALRVKRPVQYLPVQYLEEYDTVIKMLEMGQETEIKLSKSEFEKYVMDKWEWRKTFSDSINTYGIGIEDFE